MIRLSAEGNVTLFTLITLNELSRIDKANNEMGMIPQDNTILKRLYLRCFSKHNDFIVFCFDDPPVHFKKHG